MLFEDPAYAHIPGRTFNAVHSGRVDLLRRDPDEYFRRYPKPRFGRQVDMSKRGRAQELLERAIAEILNDATEGKTLGVAEYARQLTQAMKDRRLL